MQTNRLYFPPLDINGANKSVHFYLVKTVWKTNLSWLVYICTHAWRHTSDPWTPSCRGRWRGWGRGWAAHTRPRPTAEDTQPALTESRPLSRVYVAFRSKVNTRRVFLCICSDMMRRPSLPSSLLPCSRVIDEGTECASCCSKQNTERNKKYTFPFQWIGHIEIKGINVAI